MSRFVFLGDFSGLSLFLSRGLESVGADVVLYSNGDHWKNLPQGRNVWAPAKGRVASVLNQFSGYQSLLKELTSKDTLVLATEYLFNRATDGLMMLRLIQKAGRAILLHAGCSDRFHVANQNTTLCRSCKAYDLHSENCKFERQRWPLLEGALQGLDAIVPFTSVYAESANYYPLAAHRITEPINFPIDIDYLKSQCESPKIQPSRGKALHGTNRVGFKGTLHLHEMLAHDPELAEIVYIAPRMQFSQFLGALSESSLLIDQLYANGYGISGALALALGVPVLFGHTKAQVSDDFKGPGISAVLITGDVQVDAAALKDAIRTALANSPPAAALEAFAHERHDHVAVARAFLSRITPLRRQEIGAAPATP